jgi:hypothetical protein
MYSLYRRAGLGKTVQVLALVLATLTELQQQADTTMHSQYRHATLIIVPPALVSQWISEVQQIAGDALVVDFFCHKEATFVRQGSPSASEERSADVVIATYQALEKTRKRISPAFQILSSVIWGRVVLDEMQEIRSWTTSISKHCQKLQSSRRWMLSGTPITDSIDDFRGELCFLGLEPFAANNDDGFFDFAISNHWESRSQYGLDILRILSLVMLRRSKSMTIRTTQLPLLGLKPLTLTFEPVPQDASERALYCFTEFLMHATLKKDGKEENEGQSKTTKHELRNKTAFLRLLRELCVSPFLLNGGLGCTSQLVNFNKLNKDYNRLQHQDSSEPEVILPPGHRIVESKVYSCAEAIRFLSQVEDIARTDADFVTDVRVGGGGGVSRRDRALESPQEIYQRAKETLARFSTICGSARLRRAKAYWHLALEGVTTGRLPSKEYESVAPGARKLWDWRANASTCNDKRKIPFLLRRGWRPTRVFLGTPSTDRGVVLQELYKWRPHFRWAHPFAILLSEIPQQVTHEDLVRAFESCRKRSNGVAALSVRAYPLADSPEPSTWRAIVHLKNQSDIEHVLKRLKSAEGIKISCATSLPWIEQNLASAKAKRNEAIAEHKVHPCLLTQRKVSKATKEFQEAQIGLRIAGKERYYAGQVLGARAFDNNIRSVSPRVSDSLFFSITKQVEEATAVLAANRPTIEQAKAQLKRLETRVENGVSQHVESLNTFETLQALKMGQPEKTLCPICYDSLGQSHGSGGRVSLTRCGHLACEACLEHWMEQKEQQREALTCVECRKQILRSQVLCVDPEKTDDQAEFQKRQSKAKSLIQQAAEMLEANDGQLEPHLWEALYLAVDLPPAANQSAHGTFTAIPGHFLAHLRNATGAPVPCYRRVAESSCFRLPSKIRALLEDLPRYELSVVFASSKATVQHVLEVLNMNEIGCRSLYTGQTEKDSERAVSEWKSDENKVLVLIVQAGAAACGLTLTAARKMFLMEPFLKHEEEKQAYARLHRYGQHRSVVCKVYYTPVSVESRLLEWRRRITNHAPADETRVYAPLRDVSCEEEDGSEAAVEQTQTRFLLRLDNTTTEQIMDDSSSA